MILESYADGVSVAMINDAYLHLRKITPFKFRSVKYGTFS